MNDCPSEAVGELVKEAKDAQLTPHENERIMSQITTIECCLIEMGASTVPIKYI